MAALLVAQGGVITRTQVVQSGRRPHCIRRMLRRKNWVAVLPGIYVNHTGTPTWRQRVWAAVLDAALDIAEGAGAELTAIATLSSAVNKRLTTGEQLLATLQARPRMRRRDLLQRVCRDIADGTCSVLEHQYFAEVENVHGLPVPQRQAETTVGRRGFRDVEYTEYGVVVELDGRLGHADFASRDRDMERHLDAAAFAHRITIRLGTGQVFRRPCSAVRAVRRRPGAKSAAR